MAKRNRIAVPPDDLQSGARYVVRWVVDVTHNQDSATIEVDGMAAQFLDLCIQDSQLYLRFLTGNPGGDAKAIPWKRVVHLEPT